jgi:hypothetical protein
MEIPTNQEIRSFYRTWLKNEYGLEADFLPSPALATIVEFTRAALEKYGTTPSLGLDDIPFTDGLDSL